MIFLVEDSRKASQGDLNKQGGRLEETIQDHTKHIQGGSDLFPFY